jgi:hypothetical protein
VIVETAAKGKYPDADQELLKLRKATKKLLALVVETGVFIEDIEFEKAVSDVEKLLG